MDRPGSERRSQGDGQAGRGQLDLWRPDVHLGGTGRRAGAVSRRLYRRRFGRQNDSGVRAGDRRIAGTYRLKSIGPGISLCRGFLKKHEKKTLHKSFIGHRLSVYLLHYLRDGNSLFRVIR